MWLRLILQCQEELLTRPIPRQTVLRADSLSCPWTIRLRANGFDFQTLQFHLHLVPAWHQPTVHDLKSQPQQPGCQQKIDGTIPPASFALYPCEACGFYTFEGVSDFTFCFRCPTTVSELAPSASTTFVIEPAEVDPSQYQHANALRKPYVTNPKSKLDVAVGDVVNKLPGDIDIKVEMAQDMWQDKSGKCWIGDKQPKLCSVAFFVLRRSWYVSVVVG